MRGQLVVAALSALPESSATRHLVQSGAKLDVIAAAAKAEFDSLFASQGFTSNIFASEGRDGVLNALSTIIRMSTSPGSMSYHQLRFDLSASADKARHLEFLEERLKALGLPEAVPAQEKDWYRFDCTQDEDELIRIVAEEVLGPLYAGYKRTRTE